MLDHLTFNGWKGKESIVLETSWLQSMGESFEATRWIYIIKVTPFRTILCIEISRGEFWHTRLALPRYIWLKWLYKETKQSRRRYWFRIFLSFRLDFGNFSDSVIFFVFHIIFVFSYYFLFFHIIFCFSYYFLFFHIIFYFSYYFYFCFSYYFYFLFFILFFVFHIIFIFCFSYYCYFFVFHIIFYLSYYFLFFILFQGFILYLWLG